MAKTYAYKLCMEVYAWMDAFSILVLSMLNALSLLCIPRVGLALLWASHSHKTYSGETNRPMTSFPYIITYIMSYEQPMPPNNSHDHATNPCKVCNSLRLTHQTQQVFKHSPPTLQKTWLFLKVSRIAYYKKTHSLTEL